MFDWNTIQERLVDTTRVKLGTPLSRTFWSAFGAGVILSMATMLSLQVAFQTGQVWLGALVFPSGFVLIVWLRLELVTGSFLTLTFGSTRAGPVMRYWGVALVGHAMGAALMVSAAVYLYWANAFGATGWYDWMYRLTQIKVIDQVGDISMLGMLLVKGILCNVLVCLSVILALSVEGYGRKMLVSWMPIFMFVALGFEHLVVNLFLVPYIQVVSFWGSEGRVLWEILWTGMIGNLVPVLIGNFLGAVLLGRYIRILGKTNGRGI